MTNRASNEPLGPPVTRTRPPDGRAVPEQRDRPANAVPVLVDLELDLDSPSSSLSFSLASLGPVHVPATRMSPSFAAAPVARMAAPIAVAAIVPIVFLIVPLLPESSHVMHPGCPPAGPGHNGTLVVDPRSSVP